MTDIEPPMLVIDTGTDMFGEPWFQPRLLVTQMRPRRVAYMLGTFKTREDAQAAGDAALRNDNPKRGIGEMDMELLVFAAMVGLYFLIVPYLNGLQ